jgi:hypothetical protein
LAEQMKRREARGGFAQKIMLLRTWWSAPVRTVGYLRDVL